VSTVVTVEKVENAGRALGKAIDRMNNNPEPDMQKSYNLPKARCVFILGS